MRKLVVGSFITLDGVMQAPGGFPHGGWLVPYLDEVFGESMDAWTKFTSCPTHVQRRRSGDELTPD